MPCRGKRRSRKKERKKTRNERNERSVARKCRNGRGEGWNEEDYNSKTIET